MNIQKRLHHRPPFLLISEVIEHSPTMLHAVARTSGTEFFFLGHFPGTPVLPGSMMQEMTTQAAGLLITEHHSPVADYDSEKTQGWALGVLRAVHTAKYKSFVRPGEEIHIKVELKDALENSFRFKASLEVNKKIIMFNEFTLINISDDKLKGSPV